MGGATTAVVAGGASTLLGNTWAVGGGGGMVVGGETGATVAAGAVVVDAGRQSVIGSKGTERLPCVTPSSQRTRYVRVLGAGTVTVTLLIPGVEPTIGGKARLPDAGPS
jgi:hypothetical protein